MPLPSSEAPFPDALASLGRIRETLAAAQNLEHLVSSRSVGPKVLATVIPDVSTVLSRYEGEVLQLSEVLSLRYVDHTGELAPLRSLGVPDLQALVLLLGQLTEGPLHAKPRLELERQLRVALPKLVSAVAHWELLVESMGSDSVVLSVAEFLSSAPERASERPHRSVPVRGDLERLFVEIPPRVGFRCLSAWMSLPLASKALDGLMVIDRGDTVEMSREPSSSYRMMVKVPVFFPSCHTTSIVSAALGLHGAGLVGGALSFRKVPADA